MLSITQINIDENIKPVGIQPPFHVSWIAESDGRNVVQTAYRIRIFRADAADQGMVYDSGEVCSAQALYHAIDIPLQSLTRYKVKVQVRGGIQQMTAGEAAACDEKSAAGDMMGSHMTIETIREIAESETEFVSALQDPAEWKAKFITIENRYNAGQSFGTLLRREFQVRGAVKEAYLVSTAHGIYHAFLNGETVSADEMTPGWTSYNKRLLYQTYDVTNLLRQGTNAMGVMLGAGWYKGVMGYKGCRNLYGNIAAFSGQLLIRYEDGREEMICSDKKWKGTRGPVLFSEIYDGETYDARREPAGWKLPDFQGRWTQAETYKADTDRLFPQRGCTVRQHERLTPKRIFTTPEGDTVIDFGQNMAGWCEFRVHEAKPGAICRLAFFEVLDAQGNVYTENLRGAAQTLQYICRGDAEEIYRPYFTFQGFQYAKIESWPGEPAISDFTGVVVHSDLALTGHFQCSNPLLNQLWHNILWGMKGNFLDIPSDCPQRNERLGWTGDVVAFCRTSSFLMDTREFYRKWLQDLTADQSDAGSVPHVVPDILSGHMEGDWLLADGFQGGATGWGDVAIVLPWVLYLSYGDTDAIRRQMPTMKRWIGWLEAHADGCIYVEGPQFGDWLAIDAAPGSYHGDTPDTFTGAAYYIHVVRLTANMLRAIGEDEEADLYMNKYRRLKEDFCEKFLREDGLLRADTQTAYVLALAFHLTWKRTRPRLAERLVELLGETGGHLTTGFLGTPRIARVLSDYGYIKEAYALLLKEDFPSWLYQVKQGATTVWEHWDGLKPDGSMWSADMNSFNHYAYGSIGEWIFRTIAGIEVTEAAPGYEHFRIEPRIGGGLTWAESTYDSVRGRIHVRWDVTDEAADSCGTSADSCASSDNNHGDTDNNRHVRLSFTIPANTTAEIILWDAISVESADGLVFIPSHRGNEDSPQTCDCMAAQAGSGTYCISYRM